MVVLHDGTGCRAVASGISAAHNGASPTLKARPTNDDFDFPIDRPRTRRPIGPGLGTVAFVLVGTFGAAASAAFVVVAMRNDGAPPPAPVAILTLLVAIVYFLPTWAAILRSHTNMLAIFAMNLLLGWIFLGWAIAMIWACWSTAPQRHVLLRFDRAALSELLRIPAIPR